MKQNAKVTHSLRAFGAAAILALMTAPAAAQMLKESPMLAARVAGGELPPVDARAPNSPRVVAPAEPGQYGGDLRVIMGRARDTRQMVVYGYARLVGYGQNLELIPDILENIDVVEDRQFTLTLREGHKWSDGVPFTTEDFRYWWEDVANHETLAPYGPPPFMLVDGVNPEIDIIDERTIRYTWPNANPFFLPRLAAPRPEYIYQPSHYLRQMHERYADPEKLAEILKASRRRSWATLHNASDNQYNNDNPDLPTLQPWVNTTKPPSQRFVFERNPYFHRVDTDGNQLPYIDRVIMQIADNSIIPAKVGAGEADLQARGLAMSHFTFLKEAEKQQDYRTLLWQMGIGAAVALYPNLNHEDVAWKSLFRDVRFRRALSIAIDRDEINQVIFLGLGTPANNTVLPDSPLFKEEYQTAWTQFDPALADQLLDEIGLTERNSDGVRLLPDGRPLEIVVETAGEDTVQIDVLELVHDTWLDLGVKLFTRPSQREVFRNRIYAGETQMSIWTGVDNGLPTADFSPEEFAPVQQIQLQWPMWGQFVETQGEAGEAADMPLALELLSLNDAWRKAPDVASRTQVWDRMLQIHADQVYTIGIVCCTNQPVVVSTRMRGVPEKAIYSWDPGAHFGMYLPDTFWIDGAN